MEGIYMYTMDLLQSEYCIESKGKLFVHGHPAGAITLLHLNLSGKLF